MFEQILHRLFDVAGLSAPKLSLYHSLVVALILVNNLERGPIIGIANYIHLNHEMFIIISITVLFAIEMKTIAFPLSLIHVTQGLFKAVQALVVSHKVRIGLTRTLRGIDLVVFCHILAFHSPKALLAHLEKERIISKSERRGIIFILLAKLVDQA